MTRDELLVECFETADFPPGDVVLQVRSGDDVLAHLDLYWRAVEVGGEDVDVAAIGQVATDPANRGYGLASALVRTAHGIAVQRGLAWAALFGVSSLYGRIGYQAPQEPPSPDFLVCPLVDGVEWPAGPIDTRGQW
jgi:predicted N-acetyltransferase YhbS